MLISALISLEATANYPILGALGRPVQAWFLSQIMQKRPGLAEELHDEQGVKPFSVSTLLDRHGQPLRAGSILRKGSPCWFRITTIGQELSETFLLNVLYKLPKKLTIYKMDLRIDGFSLNPAEHPWAGECSFDDLSRDAQAAKPARTVRMEFVSPTAFRSNGRDIAIPIPGQVFRSLWYKWNSLVPEPLQIQDMWPAFVESCVLLSEMTAVNTQRWTFAEGTRGAAIGFTGTIGYTIMPKSKCVEQWQPYWDGAATVMQSLARFAFYSGTGHHSTIGLGQTRLLPSNKLVSSQRSVRPDLPERS